MSLIAALVGVIMQCMTFSSSLSRLAMPDPCLFLLWDMATYLIVSPPLSVHRSDLLQAVVPRMAARDQDMQSNCCSAVKELLRSDVEGTIALEAVQLVADLVKKRG